MLRPILPGCLLVLAMLIAAAPAGAQQRFQLGEEGWQKQATPAPDSPAGQLQAIRRLIVEEKPAAAEDRLETWIDEHEGHARMAEARLLMGDAKAGQRRYYDALHDYELLIRQYPESVQFQDALRREYHIAERFTGGLNRLFLGMRLLPAKSEGEELLIRIQERAPGSRIGEKASLALADYYYREGEMESAATAYDMFLINYPDSLRREWAMERLIQASLARFQGPPYDATGLLEARQRLATFVEEFPAAAEQIGADALRVRIEESLARHDLAAASWHDTRGETLSAVTMYRRLVNEHPQTAAAREALNRLDELDRPLIDRDALPTAPEEVGTAPPPEPGDEEADTEPAEPVEPRRPPQPGPPSRGPGPGGMPNRPSQPGMGGGLR